MACGSFPDFPAPLLPSGYCLGVEGKDCWEDVRWGEDACETNAVKEGEVAAGEGVDADGEVVAVVKGLEVLGVLRVKGSGEVDGKIAGHWRGVPGLE